MKENYYNNEINKLFYKIYLIKYFLEKIMNFSNNFYLLHKFINTKRLIII